MSRTELLHDDSCLRLGVCRNVVITAWLDAPAVAHARAMGRAILSVSNRYGQDFGVLNTIVGGTPHIADDFRAEIVRIVRDDRLRGHGAAHVVAIGGLGGVAIRAFLSTVFLVGRASSPNKVFSDPRAGATWFAPMLSAGREKWTVDAMLRAFEEVARAPAVPHASREGPSA